MDAPVDDRFVAVANQLADASGAVIRRYFRGELAVEQKHDRTLVTAADREAELAMRAIIAETFPDHGITGEEHADRPGAADYVWALDPIDGTHAFIAGLPLFGTLIALCRGAVPLLGVIDHPAMAERWLGVAGRPTVKYTLENGNAGEGEAVSVRSCAELSDAVLYATTPDMFQGADAAAFGRVVGRVATTRFGTDCYAYAMVASGHGDLVIEAGMHDHDFLALVPVVEGASGVITDWQGRALTAQSGGRVIAAGDERIHAQALVLLENQADT